MANDKDEPKLELPEKGAWGTMVGKFILKRYGIKPILYNCVLYRLMLNVNAALLMSQLLYWWGRGRKKDWIYKTIKEMKSETGLSRAQQDAAIKMWVRCGVLEVKRKGIPQKRHFRVDLERLLLCVSLLAKEEYEEVLNSANQFIEKEQDDWL